MQWQSLGLFIGQSTGALAFVFPDAVINFPSKACSTRSAPSSSSRRVSKAEMARRSSDPISGLPAAPFHDRQSDAMEQPLRPEPRKAVSSEGSPGITRMEPSVSTIHSRRWDGPSAKRARIGAGITVCPRDVMVLRMGLS